MTISLCEEKMLLIAVLFIVAILSLWQGLSQRGPR